MAFDNFGGRARWQKLSERLRRLYATDPAAKLFLDCFLDGDCTLERALEEMVVHLAAVCASIREALNGDAAPRHLRQIKNTEASGWKFHRPSCRP